MLNSFGRGVLLVFCLSFAALSSAADKPNVLFIAVDDLNHWVGHLKRNPQTKTPNLDRLAAKGVTFSHAYCAAPVCNPSRAALLSGRRPGATGIYDNGQPFQNGVTSDQSLVTTFKKAGHKTMGIGKLWHGGLGFADQWDLAPKEHGAGPKPKQDRSIGGIAFGTLDCDDSETGDYHSASFGIEQLQSKHEQPFFLVVGFHKPHMPWNVPKKYFDMHPLDQIELPPHRDGDLDDVPPAGIKMARPDGDHAAVLKSGRWKDAVQAYLAAISYLDAQVGRILDALEKSPHRDNTIVCLWGDHGWHLGEKQHWRKFALWEESTRAPLIWVVPGVTPANRVCERTVDFMSIYPTLCDLAGIATPKHVQGESIKSLLTNPASDWSRPGITTFGRNNHAIRTAKWRYIRYANGDEELYDELQDPYEWTNLATKSEHAAVKAELAKWLPTENNPVADEAKAKAGNKKKKQN